MDAERRQVQSGHMRAWKDWVREAGEKHRGWAHKWSNPGETWKPVKVGPEGTFTGRPRDMLESERTRLATVWGCSEKPRDWFEADVSSYRALPEITVDEFLRASRSFSAKTSQTWDGFHPRHYSLLTEEQAQVAIEMIRLIERVGVLPTVLQGIFGKLIPNHKAGALDVSFRFIGLMPSLYRLWGRVRRAEARSWEKRNKTPMIGHQSGRSIMEECLSKPKGLRQDSTRRRFDTLDASSGTRRTSTSTSGTRNYGIERTRVASIWRESRRHSTRTVLIDSWALASWPLTAASPTRASQRAAAGRRRGFRCTRSRRSESGRSITPL